MTRRTEEKKGLRKSLNKEFVRITYFFVILFLALIGYLIYFSVFQASTIVNSPYNARQDNLAENVVRGSITDNSGTVLAYTQVNDDGTETRTYPYGAAFAHVIGYSSSDYGNSGIENLENLSLLTSNAFITEKIANDFSGSKDQGDTVVTTIDANLQTAAFYAMGENKGAVVVMEASTGRILVMYSSPSFDPNTISETYETLNSDSDNSPLLNRATQGLYAPGSTFKIVTALEYMRENSNYSGYTYECNGSITYGETTIQCFDGTVHGLVDLRTSMAYSCNSSFANIGLSLDRASYRETAEELLFNTTLPCDLESSKSQFAVNENTVDAEMMMTAMGQGNTLVSPYHMALIADAVANGGNIMQPYLIDKVTNYKGTQISKNVPKSYAKVMTSQEAAQLKDYMTAVVEEGTGTLLSNQPYTVAGKTGTAEYAMDDGEKTHSWFVGFTNVDNPELVISVIVEDYDGNDSSKAVPIAKQILDTYYGNY